MIHYIPEWANQIIVFARVTRFQRLLRKYSLLITHSNRILCH